MSIFDMKFFNFLGFKKRPNAPWKKYYPEGSMDIKIKDTSLYEYFKEQMSSHENLKAIYYYGSEITYKQLDEKIEKCAKAFLNCGMRKHDVISICMPNTPEALIAFFALNKIGAISNMIHPLSSENEIKDSLIQTGSVMLLLIDIDYDKVKNIIDETQVYKVIIARANISMGFMMKFGYAVTVGHKTVLPKGDGKYVFWNTFINNGKNYKVTKFNKNASKNDPATMIHSGGSTGNPKAIVLSNGNFIALSEESKIVFSELEKGDKCLSIMPIFHGFGLGVCMYTPLCLGAECIMVPQFKMKEFPKILKHNPEFFIGVPTLFEALLKLPKKEQEKINLSHLKYAISGGDTLKNNIDKEIDKFFFEHGSKTRLIQGYGMSESLAAISLEPKAVIKDRSVGIPFPGCYIGIFDNDDKEVKAGVIGEICITGPNVMLGYYNNEKETNMALHIHSDGNVWLHSGDLGFMDKDGFITYTSRSKRMIVSSGYNVYPNQVENVLEKHESVLLCSVVGIPHQYKVEVAKAYIVLKDGFKKDDKLINEFKELCKKNLPKYAWPYEYEFRKSLPQTMIGKVDFRKLQEENNEIRQKENGEK